MRFSFLSTVGVLAISVAAFPTAEHNPELAAVAKREVNTPAVAEAQAVALKKRGGNWLNCKETERLGNIRWYKIDTWGDWDDDWGHGFLDNLRGHCTEIYDWGFWYDNGDTKLGGHASFNTKVNSGQCVLDAAWAASQATGAIWGATCAWAAGVP
ncbi:hypothetical protein ABW20_dc0103173 [Dactylellina cionopaga]|nr:hypothetical protein ABW20_dc0103173 [Dactylellina cionopaga]